VTARRGWRSTTLSLAEKHCPAALTCAEEGRPYDRRMFAVGSAAHAVLEEIGKASAAAGRFLDTLEAEEVARVTCGELIAFGRDFEGDREPPLPSDLVWRGRDLAMSYVKDFPLPYDLRFEEGVAVDREWRLQPYGKEAWLRCRIDAVGTVLPGLFDPEDAAGPKLDVIDYKSAWNADESELGTLQRKIQAVLSWEKWGEGHEELHLVVINFRLRRPFEMSVFPNTPEGAEVMARWRSEIETEIRSREEQVGFDGERVATPGGQCYGCPYLGGCAPAQEFLRAVYGSSEPLSMAYAYAMAEAEIRRVAGTSSAPGPLRFATAEEPLQIDGAQVGTVIETQRALTPNAAEVLGEAWVKKIRAGDVEAQQATMPGLIQALGVGVQQAESLMRYIHPKDRDAQARALAPILTEKSKRRFGVHRD